MEATYKRMTIKIGSSIYVVIPRRIANRLNLKEGDIVEVTIRKVEGKV